MGREGKREEIKSGTSPRFTQHTDLEENLTGGEEQSEEEHTSTHKENRHREGPYCAAGGLGASANKEMFYITKAEKKFHPVIAR